MKQNDAATGFIEPREDQVAFCFRAHRLPVRRPDVGAKDGVAPGVEIGDQRRGICEAGKPKERRCLDAGGLVRRRDTLFNVSFGHGLVHQTQGAIRMAVGMMADGVALGGGAFDQRRHGLGVMSYDKERRLCTFFRQRIKDFRGRGGGAVVECQDDFVVCEIEGARIGLKTDGGRVDSADG